jgi:hypothetical protein
MSGLCSDFRFSLIESDTLTGHSLRLLRDTSTVRFGLNGTAASRSLVASLEDSSEDIVGLAEGFMTTEGTRVSPSLLSVTARELLPKGRPPSAIVSVEPMTTDFLPAASESLVPSLYGLKKTSPSRSFFGESDLSIERALSIELRRLPSVLGDFERRIFILDDLRFVTFVPVIGRLGLGLASPPMKAICFRCVVVGLHFSVRCRSLGTQRRTDFRFLKIKVQVAASDRTTKWIEARDIHRK